jgi:hypothetical protein
MEEYKHDPDYDTYFLIAIVGILLAAIIFSLIGL